MGEDEVEDIEDVEKVDGRGKVRRIGKSKSHGRDGDMLARLNARTFSCFWVADGVTGVKVGVHDRLEWIPSSP